MANRELTVSAVFGAWVLVLAFSTGGWAGESSQGRSLPQRQEALNKEALNKEALNKEAWGQPGSVKPRALSALLAPVALPPEPRITQIPLPSLPLGVVTFQNGKALNLAVSMGSAAFRSPADPQGRVWMLTDRGPNLRCSDTKRILQLEIEPLCAPHRAEGGGADVRILPLPGFAPSLYSLDLGPDQSARVNHFVPLKTRSGKPASGRPLPRLEGQSGEIALGSDGRPLSADVNGLDPEGLVRLADGRFWIAEEFGPSLVEIAPDGTMLRRLVPQGSAGLYRDAEYEVAETLPGWLLQRRPGAGFTGLALSADEKTLVVTLRSPLALPDMLAGEAGRHMRLLTLDAETGRQTGTFLYTLEPPADPATAEETSTGERAIAELSAVSPLLAGSGAFAPVLSGGAGAALAGPLLSPGPLVAGHDVALPPIRLLVLERMGKEAEVFMVALRAENRIPDAYLAPEMRPSLEARQGDSLALTGIRPVYKQRLLGVSTLAKLTARLEAMAVIAPDTLVLLNDSEFSIDGARTHLFVVEMPRPVASKATNR